MISFDFITGQWLYKTLRPNLDWETTADKLFWETEASRLRARLVLELAGNNRSMTDETMETH